MHFRKLGYAALLLALVFAMVVAPVSAANYPAKPVKLIVPWGAGGGTDVLMRLVSQHIEQYLGKPLVVINTPGGSGTIGAQEVMHSKPDGYTILAGNDSIGMSYATKVADFTYLDMEPIALITSTPMVVAAHPDTPFDTMEEAIAAAKANPDSILYGATLGSTTQLLPTALQVRHGAQFRIVGYDGTSSRMNALLGNHIDIGETSLAAGRKYVEAGQLKLLAITTEKRHKSIPDLPTLREQGVDFTFAANRGFFAPKGTPQEVIDTFEAAVERLSKDEDFIAAVEKLGSDVRFMSTEEYTDYVKKTQAEFSELVSKMGM